MNIKRYIPAILTIFVALSAVFAKQDIQPKAFYKGENVCLVGDSITHGGFYVKEIVLFYATRFPDAKIEFFNTGISGDTVGYVDKRLKEDVLIHNPKAATLMIGMNDCVIYLPQKKPNDPQWQKRCEENLANYEKNLDSILKQFADANCTAILFTPSIYDETCALEKVSVSKGKNARLGEFAKIGKRLAEKYGIKTVDMWGRLQEINAKIQADDPKASVAGYDRVHPKALGGFAMMSIFVDSVEDKTHVSIAEIDVGKNSPKTAWNCDISNLESDKSKVSFDSLEYALPFPVRNDQQAAEKFINFGKNCGKELLKINGLDSGEYELLIDGKFVGKYTAEQFGAGVNLAVNKNTPQYEQAMKVEAAAEKFRDVCNDLRLANATEMWHKLYELKTFEERVARLDNLLANDKIKHPFIKNAAKTYKERKLRQKEQFAQTRELLDAVYAAAKPQKHSFEIKAVK